MLSIVCIEIVDTSEIIRTSSDVEVIDLPFHEVDLILGMDWLIM